MKSVASLLMLAFLLLGCKGEAPLAGSPKKSSLEKYYEGSYLILLTYGREVKIGRHKKSGIWNVPARKVTEMWVQRANGPEATRLDPYAFQTQLLELFPDIPEVHGFVERKDFTYKALPAKIRALDAHIERVYLIRQQRRERSAPTVLN